MKKMKALALDMGGSHVGCAVIEENRILSHRVLHAHTAQSPSALLAPLARTLRGLLQSAGLAAADCVGIAIGFPGIVDFRTGKIHDTLKKYEEALQMTNLAQ